VDLLHSDDELFQELYPAVLRATEDQLLRNAELLLRLVLELMPIVYTHVTPYALLEMPRLLEKIANENLYTGLDQSFPSDSH
jgi:hypothetical protein